MGGSLVEGWGWVGGCYGNAEVHSPRLQGLTNRTLEGSIMGCKGFCWGAGWGHFGHARECV